MNNARSVRSLQAGITLVELLIAMVLGLIVLGAMSTLFITNTQTRREIDNVVQQLENGRYAIRLLRDELQVAGFLGEFTSPSGIADLSPCDETLANWDDALELAVTGSNNAAAAAAFSCLTSLGTGVNSEGATGAIFVQRASTQCTTCCTIDGPCNTAVANFAANLAYFQTALCQEDLDGGNYFVLAQRGTGANPGPFLRQAKNCDTSDRGPIRPFLRKIFYVSENATLNVLTVQPGVEPSADNVEVLVEGIEDIQFEFGVDTNGDGAPDEFRDAPSSAAEWADVMGVKVWILARAPETTRGYKDEKTYTLGAKTSGPFNDEYKRHVFSTYVEFTTPAGRRGA
ncbi:putative type 4 pilus biogenesis protein [Azoarcus olearius]|uniref:PilW family protein n=1 Tax=Azoarcus sp. (strain BH72) TaxID=418699 RepID=UPI0008060EF9|nr:PilW family protein [Azoarcus olearius]ANQ85341.1 putative type 4 pilus biogenesis protein [Azoarcus olearius]